MNEFFGFLLTYYFYYTIVGFVCFYFMPTLITIGYNGDHKLTTFLINIFGFLVFTWFIALGFAFRKY